MSNHIHSDEAAKPVAAYNQAVRARALVFVRGRSCWLKWSAVGTPRAPQTGVVVHSLGCSTHKTFIRSFCSVPDLFHAAWVCHCKDNIQSLTTSVFQIFHGFNTWGQGMTRKCKKLRILRMAYLPRWSRRQLRTHRIGRTLIAWPPNMVGARQIQA